MKIDRPGVPFIVGALAPAAVLVALKRPGWAAPLAALGGFFLEGNTAVLSDADREAVLTQQVLLYPSFEWSGYGYGTFLQRGFTLSDGFHDEALISHGGNTLSMTSLWWLFPAEGVAISILSNGYGDDFTPTAVEIIERLEVIGAPTAPFAAAISRKISG